MVGTQINRSQGIELVSNPGFVLDDNAALSWDRVIDEYGKGVILTGAWRSYEDQVKFFDSEKYPQTGRYVRGNMSGWAGYTNDVRGPYRGSYWTRRAGTAAAAVPGTSNHGSGRAVDVKTRRDASDPPYSRAVVFTSFDDPDRIRFLKIAAKHGWYDTEGKSVGEHWHLTWYEHLDEFLGVKNHTWHYRTVRWPTHVYGRPGYDRGRLLPRGFRLGIIDHSATRARGLWFAKTTSGNWVHSRATKKI